MWKSRLYAFIFRRILGPYLTQRSQEKLHQSLNLSLRQGTLELHDIEFQGEALQRQIKNVHGIIKFHKVLIGRMKVKLELIYEDAKGCAVSSYEEGNARLVANIFVEGVHIVLRPNSSSGHGDSKERSDGNGNGNEKEKRGTQEMNMNDEECVDASWSYSASSRLSLRSYFQAAMDSLKLLLEINDLTIRIEEDISCDDSTVGGFMECHIASISNHPIGPNCRHAAEENAKLLSQRMTFSKVMRHEQILMDTITVTAGKLSWQEEEDIWVPTDTEEIVRVDGVIELKFLQGEKQGKGMERNLEILLDDPDVSVRVSFASLETVWSILERFQSGGSLSEERPRDSVNSDHGESCSSSVPMQSQNMDGEEETKSLEDRKNNSVYDYDGNGGLLANIIQEEAGGVQYMDHVGKLRSQVANQVLGTNNSVDENMEENDDADNNLSQDMHEILDSDDEDFQRYRHALEESIENEDRFRRQAERTDHRSNSDGDESIRLHLHLKKLVFQIYLFQSQNEMDKIEYNDRSSSGSIRITCENMDFSFHDCRTHRNASLFLQKLCIDCTQENDVDSEIHLDATPILSFHRHDVVSISESMLSSFDKSTNPAISVHFDCVTDENIHEIQTNIRVIVEPFTVFYREAAIAKLSRGLQRIKKCNNNRVHDSKKDCVSTSTMDAPKLTCHFGCERAMFIAPLNCRMENESQMKTKLPDIFGRCGYEILSCPDLNGPALSWEVKDCEMTYDCGVVDNADYGDNVRLAILFQSSIISFISPLNMIQNNAKAKETTLKLDLIAVESEDTIDPNAIVKVEFSQSYRGHSMPKKQSKATLLFPTVQPLALVKASQNLDEWKSCDDIAEAVQSNHNRIRQSLRASDPQVTMLNEISDCESVISVHVPSMAVDLSAVELKLLSEVLACSSLPSTTPSQPSQNNVERESDEQNTAKSKTAISLQCSQMSLSIHYISDDSFRSEYNLNHLLIVDHFKYFCLQQQGTIRSIRTLCHDITLYEAHEKGGLMRATGGASRKEIKEMCESLRKRRTDNITVASAIFFRSKISQPLSPKTPAILLDLLVNRDENHTERSIHVLVYDMTYRFDCQSSWMAKLGTLIPERPSGSRSDSPKDSSNDNLVLNNIFVTLSDFNLDFTTPANFMTCSRTILRVGEFRLTSNINTPIGSYSLFKVTLADAAVHIVNDRVNHNFENTKLSCARIVFGLDKNSVRVQDAPNSFKQSVSRLAFVRVLTLDCLDSTISFISDITNASVIDDNAAKCEVNLSIGVVAIYACKDSFLCFTETANELMTYLTMPSTEELEAKRNEFLHKKQQSIKSTEFVSEESVHFDSHQHEEGESFLIQKPVSWGDVIDHGLFASEILEELEDIEGEREIIDNFFASTVKNTPNEISTTSTNGAERLPSNEDIDGWTGVYHAWANDANIPEGEEQSARWYTEESNGMPISSARIPKGTKVIVDGGSNSNRPQILTRHIPIEPVMNPLRDGDMGASNYAGTSKSPQVKLRILIEDMSLNCRFFDGYDWTCNRHVSDAMNDLLVNESLFPPTIQFEPKNSSRPSRISQRYFQFSLAGLKLRLDSFTESKEHTLTSCMEMALKDLSLIETISGRSPVKLMGEWIHEEHPRDCNDGLFMMKMVSMLPQEEFSSDGQIMGNENRVTLEFLPMRFFIHQTALRFIRDFFRVEDAIQSTPNHNNQVFNNTPSPPEIFFPVVKVKSFNIKVDYKPKEIDTTALKDGSLVELLNVLPLEDMILRLSEVEMRNLTGWGSIISELACNWLQDISSTQMHKFLTRTTPLHPFASVGDGMKQFFMIPIEEYKQKGNVKKGLKRGTKKLANILAYETLSVGAKVSGFAARRLGAPTRRHISSSSATTAVATTTEGISSPSPLLRGLKEANTKMIIIPYREYQQHGTKGVVKSVVRGLPVAVCAPLSGAAEAVSHGLYIVRDQLRPDLREEEEVSKRLHDHNF